MVCSFEKLPGISYFDLNALLCIKDGIVICKSGFVFKARYEKNSRKNTVRNIEIKINLVFVIWVNFLFMNSII